MILAGQVWNLITNLHSIRFARYYYLDFSATSPCLIYCRHNFLFFMDVYAGFDEKTNDTQMSKSLLNREPKRNAGQPDLGLCGSNDALGRSCGDGLPAAPIVRASNASPRPTTHPEQDSDQLLLRLPRNRPAPVPLSSQNSGPLRGSQRPFPTPAAIGPAKTIIAAPLAASVGLVGIRQELVQGQSLLFGVVGLRSGSVIGER